MGNEKIDINIVFIGRHGSGTATTAGHLIYKLGRIDESIIESYEKEKGFDYSWLIDVPIANSESGNSDHDPLWEFETTKYCCTFPGYPLLLKADCAVLVTTGGFRADTIDDLTRRVKHKQMICCCNKMDATIPKYSKARYDEIVEEASYFLRKAGYNPDEIPFVPISALEGDNVIEKSTNLDWYEGPTLLEALDQIKEPNRPADYVAPARGKNAANYKPCTWSKAQRNQAMDLSPVYFPSPVSAESNLHNVPAPVSTESKLHHDPLFSSPVIPPYEYEEEDWKFDSPKPSPEAPKSSRLVWNFDSPEFILKPTPESVDSIKWSFGERQSSGYDRKSKTSRLAWNFDSPDLTPAKPADEEEEEAEETWGKHKDAEKPAFDEAEKKREEEESKDAPAESHAEEDDDNEADDSDKPEEAKETEETDAAHDAKNVED